MRLKNKVCVVTGGAAGIGLATAKRFAAEGAVTVIADVSAERVSAAVASLAAEGFSVTGQVVDVTNRASVEALGSAVEQQFGGTDVLVNNAGITSDARLANMTESQWNSVISVNLTGVFNCTQVLSAQMLKRGGGCILNASSIAGVYGNFGQGNYAATKAGVIGMTKSWARELGPKRVRVNAVVPGPIATSILDTVPEAALERIIASSWLRRLGQPEEVANVYLFLASDEASYVNGAVLEVSGGITI